MATTGANVLEVTHIRDGIPRGVSETGVELVLETRGREHLEALQAAMSAAGYVLEDRAPHT